MSLSTIETREAVLHELRALSEHALVVVDENPSIVGTASGIRRSFAATARVTLPLTGLLVVVEIHTGRRDADSEWLESLLAKSADVSADVSVAVSSTGFDAAAIHLAERARARVWTVRRPDLRRRSLFFDERLPRESLIRLLDVGLRPFITSEDAETLLRSGEPLVLEVAGGDADSTLEETFRHISDEDPMGAVPSVHDGQPRLTAEVFLAMPRQSDLTLQVRAGSHRADVAAAYLTMVIGEDRAFVFDRNLEWTNASDDEILHLASTTLQGDIYVNTAGRLPSLGLVAADPGVPLLSTPLGDSAGEFTLESIRMFVDPAGLLRTTAPDAPIEPLAPTEIGAWLESRDLVALMDFAAPPPQAEPVEGRDTSGGT